MREQKKAVCFFILCLLIIISSFVQAEEQEQKAKTKVMVSQEGQDTAGIRLAYEIKEKIRSSIAYELTNNTEEADLHVSMLSVSIKSEMSEALGTAISVTFLYKPLFFKRYISALIVLFPPKKDVKLKAEEIIAIMDKKYQESRSDLELLYEALMTGLDVIWKDK